MKQGQPNQRSTSSTPVPVRRTLRGRNWFLASAVSIVLLACWALSASAVYPEAACRKVAGQIAQLLDSLMTMRQCQSLNAENFSKLSASEQPLYLYALSLYANFKIASNGKSLRATAPAESLIRASACHHNLSPSFQLNSTTSTALCPSPDNLRPPFSLEITELSEGQLFQIPFNLSEPPSSPWF